jgi:glycosyltransferase involved in cell wall biosynthesis
MTTYNEHTQDARPIILCFLAFYLPGFRSGGPLRSISNLVAHLGDEFDIRIVTSDRDLLDSASYQNILINDWNRAGKAWVYYASPEMLTFFGVVRLLRDIPHDVLYLNSFFSLRFSIWPLLARRFYLSPARKCVIAPRGEFSPGALRIKSWRKLFFILYAKAIYLHPRLLWQASSELEAADIRRVMKGIAKSLFVAPDLLPVSCPNPSSSHCDAKVDSVSPVNTQPVLRITFLSRIAEMKNLDFLLSVLFSVRARVALCVYGPIADPEYWSRCKVLSSSLPDNVVVKYLGEVQPQLVPEVFAGSDLMVLPTLGENFGHVIIESLAVGTPVLISDRTPWQSTAGGGVEVLTLDDSCLWAAAIERFANLSDCERLNRRADALSYSFSYLENNDHVALSRELFLAVLDSPVV